MIQNVARRIQEQRRKNAAQKANAGQLHARAMQHARTDFNQLGQGQNHAQPTRPGAMKQMQRIGQDMVRAAQVIGPKSMKRTQPPPAQHRQGLSALNIFKGISPGNVLRSAAQGLSLGRMLQGATRMASARTMTTPRQEINRYHHQPRQAMQARQNVRQQQKSAQQTQAKSQPQKGLGHER